MAAAVVAVVFTAVAVLLAAAAAGGNAAFVEHTFVVSQINLKHLGKDTPVTVVNGQLPGPTIEVNEGDSLAVHLVNKSPYGLTIHWHGVKQRLNCWADGVGMITQCPIQPNNNFTYRFDVVGQEGTLWWHAHVACLRATVHGMLLIRPRSGADSYPFSKPDREIPVVIGEWWEIDLVQLDKALAKTILAKHSLPRASTINGKLGDLYNHSGVVEENYIVNLEQGKTYMLRIVNAALFSEYYFKVAGHMFTVVAADANYVKPYTTDTISIAPGQTIDALVIANAHPGTYYMVALAMDRPKPEIQVPMSMSRGILHYNVPSEVKASFSTPMMPQMPYHQNSMPSFYFHGNLTGLTHTRLPPLPVNIDEHLFLTLSVGSMCRGHGSSPACNMSSFEESFEAATLNNVSFELPVKTSLLEAHYYNNMRSIDTLRELPDRPPRMFNFTDTAMIPMISTKSLWLMPTSKATSVRKFRYNTSVEIVFQSTTVRQSESNPMHLHGHDFFVLAQGLGNYDLENDVKRYNLVDPPVRNTVLVPSAGWAAIRFRTDNPGMWYMHCHYEFHTSTGMGAAFQVDNGPTPETTLPPPPKHFPKCDMQSDQKVVAYE